MELSLRRSDRSTPMSLHSERADNLIGLVPGDLVLRQGLIVSSCDAESVSTQIMANPTKVPPSFPLSQNNSGAQTSQAQG